VGWWAWIARTFPNNAEAGGGPFVAVVQLSIALGSTVFDHSGYRATFFASAALLILLHEWRSHAGPAGRDWLPGVKPYNIARSTLGRA